MTDTVDIQEATRRAADLVARRASNRRRTVIGLTGPQGAGKSTVAARLAESLSASLVISTDRYLPDYDDLTPDLYDLPESADLDLLADQAASLRAGRAVALPVWSFDRHARIGYEPADAPAEGGVVIIEGIHALAPPARGALDLAMYVEASRGERRRRVIDRELGERGWSQVEAAAFFDEVADPVFGRYAEVYRAAADLIVVNEG